MSVKRMLDCTASELAAYSKKNCWSQSQDAKGVSWPVRRSELPRRFFLM